MDLVLPIVLVCFLLGVFLAFEPWKKGVQGDIALFQLFGRLVANGDVPYRDFFDHKTPLVNYINAVPALISDWFGLDYIVTSRAASLLLAIVGGLGLYFLCRAASLRPAAAFGAAVTFFAFDLLDLFVALGLEPKFLNLYIGILGLLVAYRSRWFFAGVLSALAFLTWQPGAVFLLGVFARAVMVEGRHSGRSLVLATAGFAAPLALLVAYFAIAGALNEFWSDAFLFNRDYVERQFVWMPPFDLFTERINTAYLADRWLFLVGALGCVVWAALLALQALRRHIDDATKNAVPIAVVTLGVLLYSYVNFNTTADVIPFVPWIGFWVAWLVDRLARIAPSQRWIAPLAVLALTAYGYDTIFDQQTFVTIDNGRALVTDIEARAGLEEGDPIYVVNEAWYLLLSERDHLSRYYYTRSQAYAYAEDREGINIALLDPIREEQPKLVVMSRNTNWGDASKWSTVQRIYAPLLLTRYHMLDPESMPPSFSRRAEFWVLNAEGDALGAGATSGLSGWQVWQSSIEQAEDGFLVSSDQPAYSVFQQSNPALLTLSDAQPYSAIVWVKGTESSIGESVTIILREESGEQPQSEATFRLSGDWQPIAVTRQLTTPRLASLSIHVLKLDGTGPGDSFLVRFAQLGSFVRN